MKCYLILGAAIGALATSALAQESMQPPGLMSSVMFLITRRLP